MNALIPFSLYVDMTGNINVLMKITEKHTYIKTHLSLMRDLNERKSDFLNKIMKSIQNRRSLFKSQKQIEFRRKEKKKQY